jgi:glycosyltransferase 2 family protein
VTGTVIPPPQDKRATAPTAPLFFAGDGHEPRRRRVADAVLLGCAGAALVLAALAARGAEGDEPELAGALNRLLGWLEPLWTTCYGAASALCLALLVAALAVRRLELARDIVFTGGVVIGATELLAHAVDDVSPSLGDMLWRVGDPAYPAARLALVSSVALVAAPELTRPVRRGAGTLVGLTAIASLVLQAAYPSHVLGGLALGLGAGALVRLCFGSSAGFPSIQRVRSALADLGVEATGLRYAARPDLSAARYVGEAGGQPLGILVYGRDARDAQLVARFWRQLWYRDPGPQASLTRREQVEHEALMLVLASRAGIPVTEVVAAGTASTGDAVLVTIEPSARRVADLPAELVGDDLLATVWGVASQLRSADLGHGRLNTGSLLIADGQVVVTNMAAARRGPPGSIVLSTDLAELLVSCSLLVGDERAIRSGRAAVGDEALRDALPFVQQAALSPGLRDAARAAGADVDRLRKRAADAVGGDVQEVAQLRRIRLRDVLLMLLTVVAATTLLSQLADIGLDTIVQELAGASLGWVLFGLALAQLTLVCDATATIAAVGMPLPLGPTTVLQSAIKFINLSVPSSAGKFALTVRYLQRQGVASSLAVTQGAVDGLAGFIVQAAVLVVVIPMIDIDVDLESFDASALVWVGIALLAAAVVGLVIAALVRSLRARLAPHAHAALRNVRELLSSPPRLLKLVLANLSAQILYALVLGSALRALSADAYLAELLFVNTAVTLFSGLVPVPGGIGVAEAGLTAGLVAVGIPEQTALAAALIHRLLTYYLPPVWGFVAMRWLGRHAFI